MDAILRSIYEERTTQPDTLGVLLIEKRPYSVATTNNFDAILLVIVEKSEETLSVKHFEYDNMKIAFHVVTEEKLRNWILYGTNRKIFDWLYNGKVLYEQNNFIKDLKNELNDFPLFGRKLKMGLEFAKLIRRYMDGKMFFESGHFLDAFNNVVHSLHHLARLSIIEKGYHPEITVWNQVRHIEPEVYKLYEELVNSDETIEKRLELLFLASEFLIHSRTGIGCSHLFSVLSEKEYWTINEIKNHKELKDYSVDLEILIEYLISREIISVVKRKENEQDLFERCYKIKKNVDE